MEVIVLITLCKNKIYLSLVLHEVTQQIFYQQFFQEEKCLHFINKSS